MKMVDNNHYNFKQCNLQLAWLGGIDCRKTEGPMGENKEKHSRK